MALLRQFKPEELEIIEASESFITNQKSLRQELALVESGKSKSISLEKLDEILDKAIREYED
jgi:type II secretory pathway component PulF